MEYDVSKENQMWRIKTNEELDKSIKHKNISGFGGLEVSVLAFGTRVRGFKPIRSRRIFRA